METCSIKIDEIEAKIKTDSVLFFDMDDTLVHTNLANFESYKKAIQTVTQLDLNLIYVPNRRFNRAMLRELLPDLSATQHASIIQEKEHCYREFLSKTILDKTMAEILFKYGKTNRTVLVTNCRKDRVLETLNFHRIIDVFDGIFYREIGDNKKVNKYKNAILKLGILTNTIIVFENEESEIIDAITAGINNSNIITH